MENICQNNDNGNVFSQNIEPRFNTFKNKIIELAHKNNITFNEDVFMDTIVRCMNTFSQINATDNDVDNYFWIAFKQNSHSNFSRNKFRNTINFEDVGDSFFNEEYNADIDEMVDLIENEVKQKFGAVICEAWKLHICNGLTYAELEENGYKGLNLHNEFRQIKRHICNKLIHKNNKLRMLLNDNGYLNKLR